MKINNKNLLFLIENNFDKERYQGEGLWSPLSHDLKKEDLKDLIHFYDNSFYKGLLDWPAKTAPLTPHNTKKFFFGWFLKEYLPAKIFSKRKQTLAEKEFEIFRESGLLFPEYNQIHSNFYYSFDGKSFNKNIRKFSTFVNLINNYTEHQKIKTVCEIGAGYGGLCEMLLLNNNIDTYIIIDIFETLSIAMTYLSSCQELNNYDMIYCESPEELEFSDKKRIVFIGYNKYKKFIGRYPKIDLFINSNSFVEMPFEIVKEYFDFMQFFPDVYFFSFNSTVTNKRKPFSSWDFPFDDRWKHIFSLELKEVLSRLSKRN